MSKMFSKIYGRLPVVREFVRLKEALIQLQRRIDNLIEIQAFQSLEFELQNHPRYSDPKRLLRYQRQVCSQNGEDGIIHEIFRRIGVTNRVFAEVGVGDGDENNSAFLLSTGWNGFWIDGNDRFLKMLHGRRDISDNSLRWLVSYVTRENISALFEQLAVPLELDLLSIDIDQNTYFAWEGLKAYRPRVVVVEYNAAIPADIDWKVHYHPERTWDGSQNFGASLKAFENLGHILGYSLVGCELVGANAFFVRDDLIGDKFAAPYTAENHYEPPRYRLQSRRAHRSAILDRIET
jgi:hypothetical protein